jgi:phospholipase A-2-activating protein
VLTGSENGHAFVASLADSTLSQTIPHPGTVWSVASAPDGDILTGCNDGMIRRFTRDPARVADEAAVAEFEKEVEAFANSRKEGPSKEEIDKLDKWHMSSSITKPEGTVQVFNKDGVAVAARFEQGIWIEVGEVTGYGGKEELDGVR